MMFQVMVIKYIEVLFMVHSILFYTVNLCKKIYTDDNVNEV
jgi:hypothetical protein